MRLFRRFARLWYHFGMVDWGALASSLRWQVDEGQLAASLRAFFEAGRARWPSLSVDAEGLVAHLAMQAPPDVDRVAYLQSLVAEDVFLAYACAENLPGAIEAFETHYLARVADFVAHIDRSPAFADELRQVMRERLLVARTDGPPRIAEYAGRGALMVWVRLSAVRLALNHYSKAENAKRVDDRSVLDDLAADGSPDLQLLRARYASALTEALKQAIATLPSDERVILKMYYASGQNTQRIATALRVDRSTAARRLVAARQAVFDATRRIMQAQLPVNTDEFVSLARALHDNLNISLNQLLSDRTG